MEKGGNEEPLRLYLTISGLYLKATFSSMEKHTSSCSNYIGIYTRRCIRQPLRTRQMQFQMEYTRALRLTERARQKERKRAGTHSWPAAILYHPATEAFQRWVAWECLCVSVCVQFSEEVQFNAEGRESWFICPVLLIAAFKGTAGKGDGWAWFALPFSPPAPWSDPHRDRQHHFSHGQEKKEEDWPIEKVICLGSDCWFILLH